MKKECEGQLASSSAAQFAEESEKEKERGHMHLASSEPGVFRHLNLLPSAVCNKFLP